MSFEQKFSQDITNFQRYGTYTYEFDEVGNVVFNSASNDFSQVFLGFPLSNFVYDNTKIVAFYDPTFTEFIPTTTGLVSRSFQQVQNDLDAAQQQNMVLTQHLNDLIAVNESTPSLADKEASKQVILELRKSLGQGRVNSDFSSDFPYMPIKKTENIISITSEQVIPGVTPSGSQTLGLFRGSVVGGGGVGIGGINSSGIIPIGTVGGGNTGGDGGASPPTSPGGGPTSPPILPPTRPGGGCFLAGTKIRMSNGSEKNIEDIQIGDRLWGYGVSEVQVMELKPSRYDRHYVINQHLNITWEHPVLVNWKMVDAKDLKIGDSMTRYNGTVEPIWSKVEIHEETPTFNFIVGGNHIYIANNIVVHNPGLIHKT